ncbi:nucleoid-associated protein [Carnobacterium gallinarum]
MFDFSYAKMKQIIVHFVGNKAQEQGYELSENIIDELDEEMSEILHEIFLSSFKDAKLHHFTHTTSLDYNESYNYMKDIFQEETSFYEGSENLVKQLYMASSHPNVKAGDLWLIYMSDCIIEGELTDAIGIFKVENKEIFLKNNYDNNAVSIGYEKGITKSDIDKGCIVFNLNETEGYRAIALDRLNRDDSVYWKQLFLNIEKIQNDSFLAESFINICAEFVKKDDDGIVGKSAFIKEAQEYLDVQEEINLDDFADVLVAEAKQDQFKTVVENYEKSHDVSFPDNFKLNQENKEKFSKKVKNKIKINNNISVMVKDVNKLQENEITEGFDEVEQKRYLKIYF